jgi:hypothetical protein
LMNQGLAPTLKLAMVGSKKEKELVSRLSVERQGSGQMIV